MEKPLAPLDLRHLRYFIAVAEELHFGRAALRLGIAQPPLSEQIRRLENTLGTQLLQRTQRKVALTASGRVLYDEAQKLLAHAGRVAEVMDSARAGAAGPLFLGSVQTGLFGALPAIVDARPDGLGGIEIRVTEAHTAQIVAAVIDGNLDAGLVWEDRAPPGLVIRPLERVRFIAAVHHAHPLAGARQVTLAALSKEPLVLSPREVTPHQFDRVHAGFQAAGLSPRVGQQARSIIAQLGFVASGLGYALVPAYAQRLAIAGVAFAALRESLDSVPLSLIWDPRRETSQLAAFRRQVDIAFPRPDRTARARRPRTGPVR